MSRRNPTVKSRGFFGIGIEGPKTEANVGTLWRSAVCLGADFMFTINHRYHRQASDTVAAWRNIPLFQYEDVADFQSHRPFDVPLVGVELSDDATSLERFVHPERAMYLLGPEDGSLSPKAQRECQHLVKFHSAYCLNVASAGTVVLYDRQQKHINAGALVS